ncbi:ABC transporter ATP-binding protein [Silvimonas sp.]|uniref:ABC transporter ATP-binding protein n=1 Tax=Silvimonas sp. TaxID=2650811 RepID=UPI00283BAF44|nr:ABC transporter ATP-binding protein [Silvimonas sp.]MDR3429438.1 ABC transporter ATP-binding protein [Silvimonas sp.]
MSFEEQGVDVSAISQSIAIQVEGLGKCYQIYEKPRDRLLQMLARGRKKLYREFWALSGVSFSVKRGETVGIIGRNGSGKSTLLQMICGTLNPTLGGITVNGKVAALLELGAGFNPEFSGRENVYMAASLYGLSRSQIDQRFGKIAAFADIGDHLDQPVKNYSSGMYVRLAFAVIAHVDADILVIDEALAVGDAVFTQKCMRFIRQFRENGTLLFVSHDMTSVLNLCERAIWLHEGKVRQIGHAKLIAEEYLQYTLQQVYGGDASLEAFKGREADEGKEQDEQQFVTEIDQPPVIDYNSQYSVDENLTEANGWKTGSGEILSVELGRVDEAVSIVFEGGEKVRLVIRAIAHQPLESPIIGFLLRDRLGQDLFGENTIPFTTSHPRAMQSGQTFCAEFVFRLPMLPNGQYVMMTSLADGDQYSNIQHHWLHDAVVLNVSSSKIRWGLVGIPFEKVVLN